MPRGNPDNLTPNNRRTEEEVREITRKGGIASGKARREKKNLRLALEALLETKQIDPETGKKVLGADLITKRLFEQAAQGNVKAFETLRDTVGQAPVQKVMLAEVDAEIIAEVESAVYGEESENDTTSGN